MAQSEKSSSAPTWLAGASALLSLIACYGTLAAVTFLSTLGVTLALDEGIWAGVIVAFAVLAVVAITMGFSVHGTRNPARLAIVGAALIIWAMYGSDGIRDLLGVPPTVVEIAGFVALLAAAWWDWKLRR